MKPFLERLAGGRCSFRGLGMGETAALSHSTLFMALSHSTGLGPEHHRGVRSKGLARGMRRGQVSPVNKPLKKQAREPWNERKGFMVLPVRRMPQGAALFASGEISEHNSMGFLDVKKKISIFLDIAASCRIDAHNCAGEL